MSIAPKDPDDRVDYAYDWTDYLEDAETIVSYTFDVALGDVEVDADGEDAGVVTMWLVGGTVGKTKVTNQIVTSLGREVSRTMTITVKER